MGTQQGGVHHLGQRAQRVLRPQQRRGSGIGQALGLACLGRLAGCGQRQRLRPAGLDRQQARLVDGAVADQVQRLLRHCGRAGRLAGGMQRAGQIGQGEGAPPAHHLGLHFARRQVFQQAHSGHRLTRQGLRQRALALHAAQLGLTPGIRITVHHEGCQGLTRQRRRLGSAAQPQQRHHAGLACNGAAVVALAIQRQGPLGVGLHLRQRVRRPPLIQQDQPEIAVQGRCHLAARALQAVEFVDRTLQRDGCGVQRPGAPQHLPALGAQRCAFEPMRRPQVIEQRLDLGLQGQRTRQLA